LGGEVHDRIVAWQQGLERLGVADVALHEGESPLVLEAPQVVGVPGVRQLVVRGDAIVRVVGEHVAKVVRSDEAGRAGDEEAHRAAPYRFFVRQSKPMRGSSKAMRSSSGWAGS